MMTHLTLDPLAGQILLGWHVGTFSVPFSLVLLTVSHPELLCARGKEMQNSKMAVWGGLTNNCERREVKSKGAKERYKHLNAEFQRIARRDKKAF